ncbi:hypothetical protein CC1G_07807 [Coprinopsis cinerea okayama7|uniref:Uncharacterized protein n=1 Tax=Coprinopsis cinerea (strain Okayama-7 / 130 / ATCC MYA-4618 / FGSC 9003) TaxID=240176 RepID=A8NP46_COPC7|nr:hypothetical protein CC1G_07807 [Coprinopsis cinerea okayama7\|eukprot:XP_001835264.1 hypothetical protein CC1G_07807 [Coprinopsis cinerea okayama7\
MTVLSFSLLLALLPFTIAEDVTLFYPATPAPTGLTQHIVSATVLGVSPLSVDDDGFTHYAATQVQSVGFWRLPETTTTYLTTPTTFTYTFKADASRYHATEEIIPTPTLSQSGVPAAATSAARAHSVQECTSFDNGTMSCSIEVLGAPLSPSGTSETVYATSWLGQREPFATISNIETFNIPRPTPLVNVANAGKINDDSEEASGSGALQTGTSCTMVVLVAAMIMTLL